ncbi:MAG: N-acetylmuramoyl-L-alanine amidase family protein [Planctomycetota bacterium]|jgi:N-acetylmuramoyl-L-alanine amidase
MSQVQSNRIGVWAAALLLALVGGCDMSWGPWTFNGRPEHSVLLAPYGSISVYQLAGRLDMTVATADRERAVLKNNGRDTVMLFANPDGRVFVNGKPVAHEHIAPVGELLFAPARIEQPIRQALGPATTQLVRRGDTGDRARRRLAEARLRRRRGRPVVIDAGHGGKDPGAPAVNGVKEKDVNLPVALDVARLLEKRGVRVILTRSEDVFVELNERAAIANRARAKLFVSIHSDSAGENRSARGHTLFVARTPQRKSVDLADAIGREMSAAGVASRGVREENLRVLVRTSCPSVLVELGFLSNPHEAAALARREYQRRLARAVADGIMKTIELSDRRR